MENSSVESDNVNEGRTISKNNFSGSKESSVMKGEEEEEDVKMSKRDEKGEMVAFHKLFYFADSIDIFMMIIGIVGAIGNGLVSPLSTMIFAELIDAFGQNQNSKHIVEVISKVCLKFVFLAIIASVAAFFQASGWIITGERQSSRIRKLYLKFILRQDITFFDKETNTGEVVERISGDTVLIQDAMGEKVGRFIQLWATFFGSFVVAFMKGWLLTFVMLSSFPFIGVTMGFVAIFLGKMASRGQSANAKAANIVEQTINSIRTVASFTGEKQAVTDYNKLLINASKSGVLEGLASGFGFGMIMFCIFCSYSLAVWYGSKMIIDKGYTGGDVISVITSVLIGSMSLVQAPVCLSAFSAGRAAAFKMFETIKRNPHIDAYDPSGRILDDICGNIELKDIYFSYPTRPDEPIFSGFSLNIPDGITLALVGQSGSGKSTVISLIERFYDPQAGEILIDGINLKDFQLKWIRSKIGLVSQEPVLFTSSIKDNIAYGKDGATIEEIKAAAEFANASKFIDKLPQGLDTIVGNNGTQLSGGQKQRVAIARAILKDPRILLLDEATSALDAKSERVVQEALDKIMKNRTTVIVAHRLRTVRNADMIAVIHKGKIVEKGLHGELLVDQNGAYSKLIQLQEANEVSKEAAINQNSLHSSIEEVTATDSSEPRTGITYNVKDKNDTPSTDTQEVSNFQIRRLVSLNKPDIPALILGSIAAIMTGLIFPICGLLIALATKTFFEPHSQLKRDSEFWAFMFVILGVSSLIVIPARSYYFAVAGCKLIHRIRLMCFERVVHMEVGWFDKQDNSSGAIGARLSTDATILRGLVGDTLGLLVSNISSLAAGLTIAFVSSWQLALVILVLFPILGVNNYIQQMFMKGFSADAKIMYEEASQVASDAVGSIRTVASFCAEEKVMQLYTQKSEGPKKTGIRQGLISGIGFGSSTFSLFSVYALNFYAGGRLVADGKATFSDVFMVFFALSLAAITIAPSSSVVADYTKAKEAVASIFAIIDRKSRIDPCDESGITVDSVKGKIELHNVCFTYPSRPDTPIFKDLSLSIHPGKTVALVGESGSGKSTVISLLQRFYDPDSGHISLDGIEIKKFQVKWLRQQIGLVSQEPVLFNDTIRANIGYGKEGNATETEILAASRLANAHKFISGLQQGYDTIVGERGVQLSGGQKQRVAIARAIIKSPKILLLDEATSALDAESEKVVQDALDEVVINRTTIIVAHRLSTIKNADTIAVVKDGVIVEKGNHETLTSNKDGFYASLVALNTTSSPA